MTSSRAAQARLEAQAFIDRFAGSVGPADLARLSPEARLLAFERLLAPPPGSPTSPQRTLQMVDHLMRGGQATLRELGDDLAGMSPEGRALALSYLTSHSQYRVRGLRWRPAPRSPAASGSQDGGGPAAPGSVRAALGAAGPGSHAAPAVAEPGQYTAYQEVVDAVRAVVDHPRQEAMSRVLESMSLAGTGDWGGAAASIRGAIGTLEGLAAGVSPLYRADVAVALYHLAAHLGGAGDHEGAEQAVCRSITLFRQCDDALPGAFTFDIALASLGLAKCMAGNGDYADAVAVAAAPIRTLSELAGTDFRAFGPALAEHLAVLAVHQLRSGDAQGAAATLDRSVATYEQLITRGVPVPPLLVQQARNLELGANLQSAADAKRRHQGAPRSQSPSGRPPRTLAPRATSDAGHASAGGPAWFRRLGSGGATLLFTGFAATLSQYAAMKLFGLELAPGARGWSTGGLVALLGALWMWKRVPEWESFKRAIWVPVTIVSVLGLVLIGEQSARLQAQGGAADPARAAAEAQGQTQSTAEGWWDRGCFDAMAYADSPR